MTTLIHSQTSNASLSDRWLCVSSTAVKQFTTVRPMTPSCRAQLRRLYGDNLFLAPSHISSLSLPTPSPHIEPNNSTQLKTHSPFVPNRRGFLQRAASKPPRHP